MAQVKIDSINPAMDQDRIQASLVSNNEATRQAFARITSQVLSALRLKTSKTITTTSGKLPELSAAINCSGGLVVMKAILHCAPPFGGQIIAGLYLDGSQVDLSRVGVGGATAYGDIVLEYSVNLTGAHKVEVSAMTDIGSGSLVAYTSLTVIEHLS